MRRYNFKPMRKEGQISRVFIIACVFLSFFFAREGASAAKEKPPDKRKVVKEEKNLEDVTKKLRQTEKVIGNITRKETGILEDVEGVNNTLTRKRTELKELTLSVTALTEKINVKTSLVSSLEEKRDILTERFKARLRAIYKMKSGAVARAIFSADDPTGFSKKYKYMAFIMDSDSRLMEDLKKNIHDIETERNSLGALLQDERKKKSQSLIKRKELEETLKEKRTLLAGVKKEKDGYLKLQTELEDSRRKLIEIISKLEREEVFAGDSTGFSSMKGKLIMPVKGKVAAHYGRVVHPKFNTVTFNNGILIEAPYGSDVRGVYKGTVAYVGELRGYGKVMIIDHGGGFYTLFAHLSEVLKEQGAPIEEGMVIGKVGDNGSYEKSALYFEVRQKGVPRDPLAWIDFPE